MDARRTMNTCGSWPGPHRKRRSGSLRLLTKRSGMGSSVSMKRHSGVCPAILWNSIKPYGDEKIPVPPAGDSVAVFLQRTASAEPPPFAVAEGRYPLWHKGRIRCASAPVSRCRSVHQQDRPASDLVGREPQSLYYHLSAAVGCRRGGHLADEFRRRG